MIAMLSFSFGEREACSARSAAPANRPAWKTAGSVAAAAAVRVNSRRVIRDLLMANLPGWSLGSMSPLWRERSLFATAGVRS
jgi:hypothetical protein